MTVGDAILSLVDKLLAEREKVVRLELSKQQQLNEEKQLDKDQLQTYIRSIEWGSQPTLFFVKKSMCIHRYTYDYKFDRWNQTHLFVIK